jgi:hypothetical protein
MKVLARACAVVAAAVLLCGVALGSGTTTITAETHGSVKKVTFDWLSDGAGAVDTTYAKRFSGEVLQVVVVPDGGGTEPTNAYDILIYNQDGADLIGPLVLLNIVNTTTYTKVKATAANILGVLANDKIRIVISGAGDANGGKIMVYFR